MFLKNLNDNNDNKTLLISRQHYKSTVAASKAIRGGVVHAKNEMKDKTHYRAIYNTSDQYPLRTSLHYFNFIPLDYSKDIEKEFWVLKTLVFRSAKGLLSASQTLLAYGAADPVTRPLSEVCWVVIFEQVSYKLVVAVQILYDVQEQGDELKRGLLAS